MATILNTRDVILRAESPRTTGSSLEAEILHLTTNTNKIFASRQQPRSDTSYTLREGDLWIDSGSTNLLTYSSEFSAAAGYNVNNMATTVLNDVANPIDGAVTADKIIEDTNTAGHFLAKTVTWSTIGTGTHTISIYAKLGAGSPSQRNIALVILDAVVSGTGNQYANFNLSDGTVTKTAAVDAYCDAVGGGWWRCVLIVTIDVASNSNMQIRISDNTGISAYTGNNSFIHVYGLFVEANTTSAGRYIDNTGTILNTTVGNNIVYTWDGSYTWTQAVLKSILDISGDSVLVPSEKSKLIIERDSILEEQDQLNNQAVLLGNLSTETTTFNTAVTTLTNYLATLTLPYIWTDVTIDHNTDIVGSTFRNTFTTFYAAREVYRNAITARAAELASWTNISGSGKPADNATTGTLLNTDAFCTNLSMWSGTGIGYYTAHTGLTDGKVGTTSFRNTTTSGNRDIRSNFVPVDSNKVYRVRCWVRKSSGADGVFYLIAGLATHSGTIISGAGTHWRYPASAVSPSTTWTEYSGIFGYGQTDTLDSTARYVYCGVYLHYAGTTGYHEVQGLRLEDITEAYNSSLWPNISGTNRPEDSANNIGVISDTVPSGAVSLVSSYDTTEKSYALRSVIGKDASVHPSISSDGKSIELLTASTERKHVYLSENTVVASTTMVNLANMVFDVAANSVYILEGFFPLSSAVSTCGARFNVTLPSGSTRYISFIGMQSGGTNLMSADSDGTTEAVSQGLTTTVSMHRFLCLIKTSSTAGTAQLTMGSEVDAVNVTIYSPASLILSKLSDATPLSSGGFVIDTSVGLASTYTSEDFTTSGGCTASISLRASINGYCYIEVGPGDTLSVGSPTSDTWASSGSGNPGDFEVLFTTASDSGSPIITNEAPSYTRLNVDRKITISKSCIFGDIKHAHTTVTFTIRKIGTSTPPTYTGSVTLNVDVESNNPY